MLLKFLIIFSLLSLLHIFFLKPNQINLIKNLSIFYSGFNLLLSILLFINFDNVSPNLQYTFNFNWLTLYNYNVIFGVDSLSLFFILLSNFLIFLSILGSYSSVNFDHKKYFGYFLLINLLLILVFSVRDVFFFYIFFESLLIPMFLIIGIWGSRERKIRAVYLFFFYTLIGSLFLLLAIIYLYDKACSSNYDVILLTKLTMTEQKWLWLAFFFSLASKMPLFPFHIWLPEAHVEAPTAGSVLLAGILLKLGSYGFLRFSLPFFPDASVYFIPLIYTLSILGIIYTSLTAIRQTDFKRIIAYSSIAHMSLVMMGIFSFNVPGFDGSIIQSLSHGFVASALFFIIGMLYERYHSRLIMYYSGLTIVMPIFILFFLFFTMANIAFPGTSSFIGEFLILSGVFKFNFFAGLLGGLGIVLGGAYSLWVFNRISYGNLKLGFLSSYSDINLREFYILFLFFFCTLIIGIFPNLILDVIHPWVFSLYSFFI